MFDFRTLSRRTAWLILLAFVACAPADPTTRLQEALATLHSVDSSPARRARACTEIRAALAEYPIAAESRAAVLDRTARTLVRALGEPEARREAQEALLSVGVAAYEPLCDAVLEADVATQEAAITCLIHMSNTAIPVLIPALTGDDPAASDRAARVLVRLGRPITPVLRMQYATLLEPFSGLSHSPPGAGQAELSPRRRTGIRAFARVLAQIGDKTSALALLDGAEALRHRHPDVATEHLHLLAGVPAESLRTFNASEELALERLRLTLLR